MRFHTVVAASLLRLLEHVVRNDSDQELLDVYNTCKPYLERFARAYVSRETLANEERWNDGME
jgi:hypothetical protein